jgi:hypothetical protein
LLVVDPRDFGNRTHRAGICDRPGDRQLALDFLRGLEGLGALGTASGLSLETDALKPLAEIRVTPRI